MGRLGGVRCAGAVALGLLLAACGTRPAPEAAAPLPRVSVETVIAGAATAYTDLPGRVAAFRTAEIRPQVGGIVERRLFEQGAEIEAGAPLFQLASAALQADVDTARAALNRAQAEARRTTVYSARLGTLAQDRVVSRQMYDDVLAQRDQAAADVAQAQAALARRLLDLGFTRVEAPISGRIEQARVTEGALVTAADATPMATIQQIDQVYVDVRAPAAVLGGQSADGQRARPPLEMEVVIDGQPSGLRGRLLFSGTTVDPGTGDVLLRALVDNPSRRLLPGMYVQARVATAQFDSALTVAEEAIIRSDTGAQVWVLDGSNHARLQPIVTGEQIGRRVRVVDGLRNGQRVVVAGVERLADGIRVDPRSATAVTAAPIAQPQSRS